MKARKIGLLLLILMIGGGVDASWYLRQNLGIGPAGCRVIGGRFYGPSFAFDSEERRHLPPGTAVEVQNSFGAVRVVKGQPSELRVHLRKVVFRPTEAEARTFADRIELRLHGASPVEASPAPTPRAAPPSPATAALPAVRVETNREDLDRLGPEVGFETHLEIAVPEGTAVVVDNEHGRVEVADVGRAEVSGSFEPVRVERVSGPAEVRSHHGSVFVSGVEGTLSLSAQHGRVEVQDVKGAATMEVAHGNTSLWRMGPVSLQARHGEVRLESVGGDLEVKAEHAAVTAVDVTGRAVIETSLKSIEVERVGGEARLKTDHGAITAIDVRGPLTAEGSFRDIELTRIMGPIEVSVSHAGLRASDIERGGRITASGSDVRVERFGGALDVRAERADVELLPASAIVEPLSARTTFGDIRLHVPPGSRMQLEASTQRGELSIDVPGMAVARDRESAASGRLGEGTNTVRLFAEHGDVFVVSASASAQASSGRAQPSSGESTRRD